MCSQCRPVNNYISNISKCLQDNTPDLASRMSPFAEATKENGVRKCRGASDSEEEEDGGYLLKEQNDYLQNGDGENVASLGCMKDITHQILPQEHYDLLKDSNGLALMSLLQMHTLHPMY